jgi:hypothetical protein
MVEWDVCMFGLCVCFLVGWLVGGYCTPTRSLGASIHVVVATRTLVWLFCDHISVLRVQVLSMSAGLLQESCGHAVYHLSGRQI